MLRPLWLSGGSLCVLMGARLYTAVPLLVLAFAASCIRGHGRATGREAYISLAYSDSFVLGLRVLGQSLRETGTSRRACWGAERQRGRGEEVSNADHTMASQTQRAQACPPRLAVQCWPC